MKNSPFTSWGFIGALTLILAYVIGTEYCGLPSFHGTTTLTQVEQPKPVAQPAAQDAHSKTIASIEAKLAELTKPRYGIGAIIESGESIVDMKDDTIPLYNRAGNPMLGRILKDSPADKAGLKPGDGIKSIRQAGEKEATSTKGLTHKQIVEKIRGEDGTIVILEIDALPAPVEFKREQINLKAR